MWRFCGHLSGDGSSCSGSCAYGFAGWCCAWRNQRHHHCQRQSAGLYRDVSDDDSAARCHYGVHRWASDFDRIH
ncbi:Uncharacterised protein [Vibrio cholerae]|nr:Uncharacterised protein [Vibrio cholerae]